MNKVKIVYHGGLKSPVDMTDEKCTSFQAGNLFNDGLGRELLFLPHGKVHFAEIWFRFSLLIRKQLNFHQL